MYLNPNDFLRGTQKSPYLLFEERRRNPHPRNQRAPPSPCCSCSSCTKTLDTLMCRHCSQPGVLTVSRSNITSCCRGRQACILSSICRTQGRAVARQRYCSMETTHRHYSLCPIINARLRFKKFPKIKKQIAQDAMYSSSSMRQRNKQTKLTEDFRCSRPLICFGEAS